MLLSTLVIIPIIGIVIISSINAKKIEQMVALATSILNLIISLVIFLLFNNSTNQFQFVQEHYNTQLFDVYLGIDGVSIFFVLLTTIIMPIALLAN
jgi:NADH:ubiquinone oxidoreductase subunit 4 (subunit M)